MRILGYLFLLGPIAVGCLWAYDRKLENQVKESAETTLGGIVNSDWSMEKLESALVPEATQHREEAAVLLAGCRMLGKVTVYNNPDGRIVNFVESLSGAKLIAPFHAKVVMEEGTVDIRAIFTRIDGEWKIAGFSVESPQLTADMLTRIKARGPATVTGKLPTPTPYVSPLDKPSH